MLEWEHIRCNKTFKPKPHDKDEIKVFKSYAFKVYNLKGFLLAAAEKHAGDWRALVIRPTDSRGCSERTTSTCITFPVQIKALPLFCPGLIWKDECYRFCFYLFSYQMCCGHPGLFILCVPYSAVWAILWEKEEMKAEIGVTTMETEIDFFPACWAVGLGNVFSLCLKMYRNPENNYCWIHMAEATWKHDVSHLHSEMNDRISGILEITF